MGRTICSVGGIDGSGKSVFASRLAELCGRAGWPAARLSTDDYRCPRDFNEATGAESDRYYNSYYDFTELDRTLNAILDGAERVAVPVYDSHIERRSGTRDVDLSETNLVVLDGVFVERLSAVSRGISIFLQTTLDEAQRRIVERDLKKGRSPDEVERRIRNRYFPSHARYSREHHPVERADVVIDNERIDAPRLVRMDGDALALKCQDVGSVVARQLREICAVDR